MEESFAVWHTNHYDYDGSDCDCDDDDDDYMTVVIAVVVMVAVIIDPDTSVSPGFLILLCSHFSKKYVLLHVATNYNKHWNRIP